MKRYSPAAAQQALLQILDEVNQQQEMVVVTPTDGNDASSVVIVAKHEWEALKAALEAAQQPVQDTGYLDLDKIEWG
ncbi:type II toxin-antitoxin system Phd/YefM family antitoxin [Levilactobacillus parabrevis]|uniref:type II toxin-antitoxin system Phd/YefM family antitoxin n=1 Tax=Levilactobacillus parabrevis TaxID=357278 RepID=UPI0021A2999C|nr:type II toxin-antitoxin system Phd/YefM family antitoxin [Levilactobacillus parabrevis]MCT4486548.1 type II toxin-antitoxin system Phd/YefM family antitoxin [Levilactobacillus parabrevis]MCT4489411.1 type II toxin-antitoxin system Phd/YefM family antitoxin [Levilactobacillus parabrevis]